MPPEPKPLKREPKPPPTRRGPPELYQIVVQCSGEEEQRELFDRLTREGRKLRLLVL